MNSFRSLVAISSLLKAMNGKNIERSPHPPSLTCVSVLDLLLVLESWLYLCFCQRNNKLVWDATVEIMSGLFNEVWAGKDAISMDHALELTMPVWFPQACNLSGFFYSILNLRSPSSSSVLQVISIDFLLFCRMLKIIAFGKEMTWNEDTTVIPEGHQVTMKDALHVVSSGIFAKIIFPDWSLQLTKRLQIIKISFEEFQVQITDSTDIDVFELHHPISVDVYVWNDRGAERFRKGTTPWPLEQLGRGQRWESGCYKSSQ